MQLDAHQSDRGHSKRSEPHISRPCVRRPQLGVAQVFAFSSRSSITLGRNAQSTFGTCKSLKTNTGPFSRAERPGASSLAQFSAPASNLRPGLPEKSAIYPRHRMSRNSRNTLKIKGRACSYPRHVSSALRVYFAPACAEPKPSRPDSQRFFAEYSWAL